MALALTAADTAQIDRAVSLHGELCPGLATGIQLARLALREVGESHKGHRVLATAETDGCAVDAVQALTGCTVGNRRLLTLDHGKLAFRFRSESRAVRISSRRSPGADYRMLHRRVVGGGASVEEMAELQRLHHAEVERILSAALEELFTVEELEAGPLPAPVLDEWLVCPGCGEEVSETRTAELNERRLCIACHARAAAEA